MNAHTNLFKNRKILTRKPANLPSIYCVEYIDVWWKSIYLRVVPLDLCVLHSEEGVGLVGFSNQSRWRRICSLYSERHTFNKWSRWSMPPFVWWATRRKNRKCFLYKSVILGNKKRERMLRRLSLLFERAKKTWQLREKVKRSAVHCLAFSTEPIRQTWLSRATNLLLHCCSPYRPHVNLLIRCCMIAFHPFLLKKTPCHTLVEVKFFYIKSPSSSFWNNFFTVLKTAAFDFKFLV